MGPGDGDCLATSLSTDPEAGLELNFFQGADGHYLKIAPPGISMAGFEVPTGGISLQGQAYLFCTTDHSSEQVMGRSLLVRFDPTTKRFETVRDISKRPGNFINVAAHLAQPGRADYRKRTRPKRFSCGEAVRIGGATHIWHVSPLEKSNRARPRSILPAWMVKETRSGARTSCRQSRWCSIQ